MKRICAVYRSSRREGMYLYVDKSEGLERVPESLLAEFGRPQPALTLVLTPERRLARAQAAEVLAAIADQGYFLQLPPTREDLLQGLRSGAGEAARGS